MAREIKATPRREERLERGSFEVSSKKRGYAANDETFFSSEDTKSEEGENVPLTLAEKATDHAETELEVERKAVKKPKPPKS